MVWSTLAPVVLIGMSLSNNSADRGQKNVPVRQDDVASELSPQASFRSASSNWPRLGPRSNSAGQLKREIAKLTSKLINRQHAEDVVVGVIRRGEKHVFGFSRAQQPARKGADVRLLSNIVRSDQKGGSATASQNSTLLPVGDAVFEIGSISKTLTTTLLADMVLRGEVRLDDPVSRYLPKRISIPNRGRVEITLEHLATHTSGLPRMPGNLPEESPNEDSLAAYTLKELYADLSHVRLHSVPGTQYSYSNLGTALLGHALARCAGQPFDRLIHDRVAKPLGMTCTGVFCNEKMQQHELTGFHVVGVRAPAMSSYTFAGAGMIRSTANDMLRYLSANLNPDASPLGQALRAAQKPRRNIARDGTRIGLGWEISRDRTTYGHGGSTAGFQSFCMFDRSTGTAVVVLCNTGTADAEGLADDIMYLLDEK
jgi:CubicO group peptidase (beta-lactamase class C family)